MNAAILFDWFLSPEQIHLKPKKRTRHDKLIKVAQEISKDITGTILNNEQLNSSEISFLVNSVKSNVDEFLQERKTNLEVNLADCNNALEALRT